MRLKLSIQRHALPTTHIIWTVRRQDLPSTPARCFATISQLLEDVNDIVPLESDDWGLEDYTVEVHGYECLHFQPIESVLKEDDEVTIRALQTNDLRIRRLGGRHQISSDGRHLFDGVAFGRPYLRKTTRPPFHIPPRKKRKLEVGDGQHVENESLVLYNSPEAEDTRRKALPMPEDEDKVGMENGNLPQLMPQPSFEAAGSDSADDEDDSDFDVDVESSSDDEEGLEDLELSDELKGLVDESSILSESAGQVGASDEFIHRPNAIRSNKRKRRYSNASENESGENFTSTNLHPEQAHIAQPRVENDEISNDSTDAEPDGLNSPDTSSSGTTSSLSESKTNRSRTTFSSSSSLPSYPGSYSPGNDSDSDSRRDDESTFEAGSEPGSESTSDSSSESETESHELDDGPQAKVAGNSRADVPARATTAPGKGSMRTKKNNLRHKKRRTLARLKASGLLAPNAGFRDLSAYEVAQLRTQDTQSPVQDVDPFDEVEARKQQILRQLPPARTDSDGSTGLVAIDPGQVDSILSDQKSAASSNPGVTVDGKGIKYVPQVRAKLDLESSRRMVFGSLGLKTPKTPAEEQRIREKLAQRFESPVGRANTLALRWQTPALETDEKCLVAESSMESWKEKIDLYAVECEIEDQILSPPPFPFVQRWEACRTREKIDSQRRRELTDGDIESPKDGSCNTDRDMNHNRAEPSAALQKQLLQKDQELPKQVALNSSTALDMTMTTDFNLLEELRPEDAVVDNVIAFKQLEVSKGTGWQPQVSTYRTAKVQEILDDGTLRVLLAERDTNPTSQSGDHQTNERSFEKFEMPFQDSQEESDTGVRELLYSDLIEPKLVERLNLDASTGPLVKNLQVIEEVSQSQIHSARIDEPGNASDCGVERSEVEVSTPRKKEISKIIRDAGFESTLDSELLQPSPNLTEVAPNDQGESISPAHILAKRLHPPSLSFDGTNGEPDAGHLNSPHYTPWDSSVERQEKNFFDGSSVVGLDAKSPGTYPSPATIPETAVQNDAVVYPRLSQLVLDEPPITRVEMPNKQSNVHVGSSNKRLSVHIDSDRRDHDLAEDERQVEGQEEQTGFVRDSNSAVRSWDESSHFDSLLQSVIPPSSAADMSVSNTNDMDEMDGNIDNNIDNRKDDNNSTSSPDNTSRPASSDGSRLTNPVYDSSEGSYLPSLSEITSTAQSRKVSPPPESSSRKDRKRKTKKEKNGGDTKRGDSINTNKPASKVAADAPLPPPHPQPTQTSSSVWAPYPSSIPTGSQVVDLTGSSDPISPEQSGDELGSMESTWVARGKARSMRGLDATASASASASAGIGGGVSSGTNGADEIIKRSGGSQVKVRKMTTSAATVDAVGGGGGHGQLVRGRRRG